MSKHRFDREDGLESDSGLSIPTTGWRICFDGSPGEAAALRAEPGDILGLFRAWDADRRESDRYCPAETKAWIGWWQATRFVVNHARLVNLSPGGALILLRERPPMGQPVWLCLGTPHPVDHVQARLRDAQPDPTLPVVRARLEFHLPCPAAFFVAAGRAAMS